MERGRQVLRQWRILRLLESARLGHTVKSLCDELGIDADKQLRTVYRDLDQLVELGFPIEKAEDRFVIPRASVSSGWTLPLQPSHVLALRVSLKLYGPLGRTWLAAPLEELRTLLDSLLPEQRRAYCAELESQMTATLSAPLALEEAHSKVAAVLEEAIHLEQTVVMRYAAVGRPEATRQVDPHGLWFHDGGIYLVGYCHARCAMRTFALQRIREAELTDETFEQRPDFDLEAFTNSSFGAYHGPAEKVRLELLPEAAHLATERRLHSSQTVEALSDGRVRLEMTVGGLPALASWIAGHGGAIRVLHPPALKALVLEKYRRGLELQSKEGAD